MVFNISFPKEQEETKKERKKQEIWHSSGHKMILNFEVRSDQQKNAWDRSLGGLEQPYRMYPKCT